MSGGWDSLVLVPFEGIDTILPAELRRLDPSAVAGVPAHVTLLYPFVDAEAIDDAVGSTIAAVCAAQPSFEVDLVRTDRFRATGRPDVLILRPEPADPFIAMSRALRRAYPEIKLYGVDHGDIVPHITIGRSDDHGELDPIEAAVAEHLPLAFVADEVWLMTMDRTERWSLHTRFPLEPVA